MGAGLSKQQKRHPGRASKVAMRRGEIQASERQVAALWAASPKDLPAGHVHVIDVDAAMSGKPEASVVDPEFEAEERLNNAMATRCATCADLHELGEVFPVSQLSGPRFDMSNGERGR